MPAPSTSVELGDERESETEADADVQLVRSLLAGVNAEGGYEDE